jgi:hypothetical protein
MASALLEAATESVATARLSGRLGRNKAQSRDPGGQENLAC